MVEWSIDRLGRLPDMERIVVALPPGAAYSPPGRILTVCGGDTRSRSVRNALQADSGGDPVIVHDAARPLASLELFQRALRELSRTGADAVIAASAVSDTIKEVGEDGRTVARTLDRSRLWAVQTPQVFRRAVLERALDVADDLLAAATDDAWLVERVGGVVRVVESDPSNIKITSAADLRIAEMLLAEGEDR